MRSEELVLGAATLTVIILTMNEEINLQSCLDSTNWADDRVVVDSGSTDSTLQIAAANQVRHLVHRSEGATFLISEQRNWALRNADIQTGWVLFIDADEVVPPTLEQHLKEILPRTPQEITLYRLTPKFMFLDHWLKRCQGYPNWHDRLIRRDSGLYKGGVWEHYETGGQKRDLTVPYIHYSLNKGIGDWFNKHERYATAEADDIFLTHKIAWKTNRPNQNNEDVRTIRKRGLRDLSARFWPFRPVVRFTLMYFIRLGFLDGLPGLLYCLMMMCYEYIVVLKVIELRRRAKQQPI